VREARTGDREAFCHLVDLYWDRIRRWVFALTHHAQEAEDLTQDVFLKAWVNLKTLEEDGYFRAWLFRIARNLAFDQRKRRPLPVTGGVPVEALTAREGDPLDSVLSDEAEEMLQAACNKLPDKYRIAYLLWAQERLPFAELAEILGISEVNARWRVCQARQSLLRELAPLLEVRAQ